MVEKFEIIESAGGILVNNQHIALIKNVRAGFGGFPKGTIETNETALEAAKREVEEETGIKNISSLKKLGTYKRNAADGSPVVLKNHIFLFETMETKLNPSKKDALDAQWLLLNEVKDKLTLAEDKEFFQSIKKMI
mgnify:CR=1 FL=1